MIAAVFSIPEFAYGYPETTGHEPILKCQTSCHKAENVSRAKFDKHEVSTCRECHGGGGLERTKSPFRSPIEFIATGKTNRSPTPPTRRAPAHPPKHFPALPGMALVPEGEFVMGSNERWDDESPEFIARTETFYIDLREVTNEDYAAFVLETGQEAPYHWVDGKVPQGKEKHPVVYVNWFDADAFCHWKGKRLPTEEEWEKAARGENGNIYPWGNEWVLTKSNNPYKHSTGTEPVGSYPEGKSPYGLDDMSGNVWEWVDSYYLPHPGNTVPKAAYSKDKRVLKGGSWFDCLSYGCGLSAPTFNRSFFTPEVRNNSFGFRCAKSP